MVAWIMKLLRNHGNRKLLFRLVLLVNILIVLTAFSSLIIMAYGANPSSTTDMSTTNDGGSKFLGAGIAVAGSTLGAGIAIYGAASSGMAALVEKSELSTWLLLLAGLGEGVAIYGLIIAIMIIGA